MGVAEMERSSMHVHMSVEKVEPADIAFSASLLLVNFDSGTMGSRAIPDWVRGKIAMHEGLA